MIKVNYQLTSFEENYGSEAGVFSGINVHLLELGNCFLERFDFAEKTQLAFRADG